MCFDTWCFDDFEESLFLKTNWVCQAMFNNLHHRMFLRSQEAATMEEKKAEEEAADTEVPAGEAIAEGQERAEKAGGAKVGRLLC